MLLVTPLHQNSYIGKVHFFLPYIDNSVMTTVATSASRGKLILAFAAVYVVWGSTYLAIRFAIETIPPFLMAGMRFLTAGSILYTAMRLRGEAAPSLIQWRSAAVVGILMLVVGNGGVTWAEQVVPSGITSLLVATVPLWMVMLDWLWHGNARPNGRIVTGLVLGIFGTFVLIGPTNLSSETAYDLAGVGALLVATLGWSFGSLFSKTAPLPRSPFLATAMEMLSGGAVLVVLSIVTGETARLHIDALSARSALSFVYLVLFGSLIGFTAYIWLLHVTTPAKVATYAYVNPVIALFLGWGLAGESLTIQSFVAALIILAAVVLIVTNPQQKARTNGNA